MTDRIAPVVKSLTVPLAPTKAFALFTDGIAGWWPLATHSIGEARAVACAIEPRVGGRVYERHADGSEMVWGHVRLWEPPARLVITWHPGRPEDTAQEIEIGFAACAGGTRVELSHRGWERAGETARKLRDRYESGWEFVLGRAYAAAAGVPQP
jgi:uncharacterized protein YndB with AHSA1/START domain